MLQTKRRQSEKAAGIWENANLVEQGVSVISTESDCAFVDRWVPSSVQPY